MPSGSKPGERRGGRKKGSINHVTKADQVLVASILAAHNYNPIEEMISVGRDPLASRELRGRMASEVAQYAYSKMRAMDVTLTGPDGGPVQQVMEVVFIKAEPHD